MQDDGWLCEDDSCSLSAGWEFDAPWLKANMRHAHMIIVRAGACAAQVQSKLGHCKGHDLLRMVFYGNAADINEFCGLSEYYNTRDSREAQNAVNVLDGGSETDRRTSAWLVGWSHRTIFMVNQDGQPLPRGAFVEDLAVIVRDWRYAVRIANVDPVAVPNIAELMTRAVHKLPTLKGQDGVSLRPMFYVNRDLRAKLRDAGILDELSYLRGVPVRTVDELRNDEPYVA